MKFQHRLGGVGVRVSIDTGPVVSGEGSEKPGPDESNNGNLGDTSVDELSLTVPGEVTDLSVASLKTLE